MGVRPAHPPHKSASHARSHSSGAHGRDRQPPRGVPFLLNISHSHHGAHAPTPSSACFTSGPAARRCPLNRAIKQQVARHHRAGEDSLSACANPQDDHSAAQACHSAQSQDPRAEAGHHALNVNERWLQCWRCGFAVVQSWRLDVSRLPCCEACQPCPGHPPLNNPSSPPLPASTPAARCVPHPQDLTTASSGSPHGAHPTLRHTSSALTCSSLDFEGESSLDSGEPQLAVAFLCADAEASSWVSGYASD